MPPKKELCRNFQRGSCKYGERCNYSHQVSQQQRSNHFGNSIQNTNQFQTSNNQQPNPFGFGVKSNSQPRGVTEFGSKQNPSKPFENKWSRTPENQPQATPQPHNCADPESCKRQIKEDFEHERPLWKLTCYGHNKGSPCDIVGDISFEELRATAYNDAKQGLALQFIVEKERNLLNAKLQEFDNLLRNPYTARQTPVLTTQNAFSATSPIVPSIQPAQNISPLSVSSFSQLAASPSKGFGHSSGNNAFGQSTTPQTSFQATNGSATNTSPFARAAGSIHGQIPNPSFGNGFSSNAASFNNVATGAGQNIFPSSGNNQSMMGLNVPTNVPQQFQFPSLTNNQSQIGFNGLNSIVDAAVQSSLNMKTSDGNNIDKGIWSKAEWIAGEIPEEAPPDDVIF
ncbi:zinc finger CCCH domain-containing protein 16 isoform X2 [Impatiens glandulifera]|uniref:zinc finger CCCH domain-containing protein 16 isoform X2 n=1 Tax=Impatiens glandulifera TaxID=253017 RepID=UPI001FB08CC9|nr:zinc finger CCCH domain-containing protein 16 isoform X2 [Impatiens glandulifera]